MKPRAFIYTCIIYYFAIYNSGSCTKGPRRRKCPLFCVPSVPNTHIHIAPIHMMPPEVPKKGYRHYLSVVPLTQEKEFASRCVTQLEKLGTAKATEPAHIFGDRVLNVKTKRTYISKIRKFVEFLLFRSHGAFDKSLLLFYEFTPRGIITCQAKAASYFLLAMYTPPGRFVKDVNGKEVVVTPSAKFAAGSNGKLDGWGKWKDPGACVGFQSALGAVHVMSHGRSGPYTEKCELCAAVYPTTKTGCAHHPTTPRPIRMGDVIKSTQFINTISHIQKDNQWKPTGATHLLPSEVRKIGQYCVHSNDPCKFMVFVLFLVAINLFLRKFEFSSLTGASFITSKHFMTGEDVVEALHLQVDGKQARCRSRGVSERFSVKRSLFLWSKNDCPDLDPVRMLLAFLHIIGWKGGVLFPSFKELKNPPSDGIYKHHMTEGELYMALAPIYQKILGRTERLATHTTRKSGYLWAVLSGCHCVTLLMMAACHKCPKVATLYIQDAHGIAELNNLYGNPANRV
jgi:hypothetical protein